MSTHKDTNVNRSPSSIKKAFCRAVEKCIPWTYPLIFPATLNGLGVVQNGLHVAQVFPPASSLQIAIIMGVAGFSAIGAAFISTKAYNVLPVVQENINIKEEGHLTSSLCRLGQKAFPAIIGAYACFEAVSGAKGILLNDNKPYIPQETTLSAPSHNINKENFLPAHCVQKIER